MAESANTPPGPGRGWNDPPLLPPTNGMSPSTGAIKKTGINLNKRVAFPLSGNSTSSSRPILNAATPPMIPPIVTLPKQIEINSSTEENTTNEEQTEDVLDLKTTMDNFDQVLSNTVNFGGRGTVHSELQNMKSMWVNEELNDDVCLAIQKLSQALLAKDTKKAQDELSSISKSLVHRHDSVEWASALRSLVNYFALAAVYCETTTAEVN